MSQTALQHPDKNTALPLYKQIKQDIRSRIQGEEWAPGTRLPSENDLVHRLGVSRMTVHRALRELTQEGLLERVHGLGTFVASPPRHASLITLQDIAEEIEATGSRHSCELLVLKRIRANLSRAREMELRQGEPLFHLKAVHFQDQEPIQLEDRLVNPSFAPDFLQQDFTSLTTTQYLVSLVKPDEMEHTVRAVLPEQRTARALSMNPADPCLELHRRTWKDGAVVTSVRLTYPGHRYDLAARYQTDQFTIR